MRIRSIGFLPLLILAILPSVCFSAGKAESVKFDSFWKSESPIVVPVTDKDGVASVQFPAMPQKKGELPVIRFKAYLKTSKFAGWSQYMHVDLNGKPLGGDVDGAKARLLNRDRLMTSTIGSESPFRNNALLTFFGPAGDEVDPRITSDRQEGYWYLLDVSDVANKVITGWDDRIESQEPNKLSITSTYHKLTNGDTADCKEFVVENLEAGYISSGDVLSLRGTSLIHMYPASGPSISAGDGVLTIDKSGALELKVGSESYFFTGDYSYPGKDGIAYNSIGIPRPSASDWKVTVKGKSSKLTAIGVWKDYSVVRTIVPEHGRFKVCDKITNKTAKPLGMQIRYNAITNNEFNGKNAYLCGSSTLTATDNCATNPSVFLQQPGSSMGMVVEDTLFRLQMEVVRRDNSVEYATRHFGLAPKKSYTLEWAIYPSKDTDFWSFVNRVRKDWNVNYTIVGPCPFGDENIVPGRKGVMYPMNPWWDFEKNQALDAEAYKALIQPKVKKLLAAQPYAIPMAMLDTNLVPYDTRESNGKIPAGTLGLPDSIRTGYGVECDKEQTEYIKKTPWWDSVVKTADGRAVIDTYYAPAPYCDLMVYPAPGNYQLKYMLHQIDYSMDVIGLRGIYMDQFNIGIKIEQPGRPDYSKWDGHTVNLKPNGDIEKMYTDVTYVGAPARAEIIKRVRSKGGVVMTNGHPVDRETASLGVQAVAETEWDLSSPEDLLSWNEPPYMPAIAEGQLSSPISLGIRPGRFGEFGKEHWAEIMQKWVITCLKSGTVYYYYAFTIPTSGPGAGEYGIINHMFPFTPVELHSGWLVGKERILTAKSGSFFWDHSEKPIVLAFDLKGYGIKPAKLEMTQKGNGWQVDLGIKDWQETAVITDASEK